MSENPYSKYLTRPVPSPDSNPNPYAKYSTGAAASPASPTLTRPDRTWGEAVKDTAVAAAGGVGSTISMAGDLGGLVTGNMDNSVSKFGQGVRSYWDERKSEPLKQKELRRSAAIQEAAARGPLAEFGAAIKETITDPALFTTVLAENAANLIPGAAAGRLAKGAMLTRQLAQGIAKPIAAAQAAKVGVGAAIGTGAVQQASDVAGSTYRSSVENTPWEQNPAFQQRVAQGENPEQVKHELALTAARTTFGPAAAISAAANMLPGGRILERALVGGAARNATGKLAGMTGVAGTLARGAAGALGEGTQEAVEEGGGAFTGNLVRQQQLDPNQSLSEGVGESAGIGFAAGLGLGAPAGVLQRPQLKRFPDAAPGSLSDAANITPDVPKPVPAAQPVEQPKAAEQKPLPPLPSDLVDVNEAGEIAGANMPALKRFMHQHRALPVEQLARTLGLDPEVVNAAKKQVVEERKQGYSRPIELIPPAEQIKTAINDALDRGNALSPKDIANTWGVPIEMAKGLRSEVQQARTEGNGNGRGSAPSSVAESGTEGLAPGNELGSRAPEDSLRTGPDGAVENIAATEPTAQAAPQTTPETQAAPAAAEVAATPAPDQSQSQNRTQSAPESESAPPTSAQPPVSEARTDPATPSAAVAQAPASAQPEQAQSAVAPVASPAAPSQSTQAQPQGSQAPPQTGTQASSQAAEPSSQSPASSTSAASVPSPNPTTNQEAPNAEVQRQGQAPAEEVAEFEHSGTRVYPIKVRGPNGEAVQRWAVESADNKARRARGERTIGGDSLAESPEQARVVVEQEAKRDAQEAERTKAQEATAAVRAAEDAARKERNSGKTLSQIKADKYLQGSVKDSASGKTMTREAWVRAKVAEGATPSVAMVDKVKPMSRAKFNRASNEEQRAHEKRVKEGGKVPEYSIGNFVVTKTEHDLAAQLAAEPKRKKGIHETTKEEDAAAAAEAERTKAQAEPAPASEPGAGVAGEPGFIRPLSATEKKSGREKQRAWQRLIDEQPREGFDVVFMPRGPAGPGFYYTKTKQAAPPATNDVVETGVSDRDPKAYEPGSLIKAASDSLAATMERTGLDPIGIINRGAAAKEAPANERDADPSPATESSVDYERGQEALTSRLVSWARNLRLGRGGPRPVESRPETIGPVDRSETGAARQGDESKATLREQSEKLIARAKAEGFFWDADSPILAALSTAEVNVGAEHQAFMVGEGENRFVIRATDNGFFGPRSDISPAQYLARLDDYSGVFPGLQTRLIGVSESADIEGHAIIWTAQVFVRANKFRDQRALQEAMAAHGWELDGSDLSPRFRHKESGVIIEDAHTDNVFYGNSGEVRPFDVVVEALPSERQSTSAAPLDKVEADDSTAVAPDPATLDGQLALFGLMADGKLSLGEYKAGFAALLANRERIITGLAKLTKEKLVRMNGRSARMSDSKDSLIRGAYGELLTDYNLETSFSWSMGEKIEDVMQRRVDAVTEEALQSYAARVAASRAARVARVDQVASAIKDPKTYEDFATYINAQKAAGKTFTEARATLSLEQRAELDRLMAEKSRGERLARKTETKAEVRSAGDTVANEVIATKHTKLGHDLFVVRLADRVSREDYQTLNQSAKRLGGSYSSYRGNGAVPGFQFRNRESAEAFRQLVGGDTAAAKDLAKARRDAFDDDRSQSAAERLTEMAERLDARASESLAQERKANTSRRAGMAARAEAAARADQALAKTMRNIAAAIESGKAGFLNRVRQKTQVELMGSLVRTAHDNEIRAKYPSYADQERQRGSAPTEETVEYAEWPQFTAFRSDLAALARQLVEVEGTKKLGKQLLNLADDVTAAYKDFAKKNLHKVSTFSSSDGRKAEFQSKAAGEAAITRSGYRGRAILFSPKRNQHVVIMSPSEAIQRGIWDGDGDKRLTVTAEFGNELVEKIGKAARRGAKVSVPWQFETAHARRAAFSRMGIETAAEFRTALRQFIALREAPAAADKVKELERSMVGRRNDGLDFFPTPQSVADEMVDAAAIEEGMTVLEPSAGMGHIAERVRAAGVEPDVVEMSSDRKELLEAKGFNVVGSDFLDVTEQYDRIVMNPPFSDSRDIQHVRHAYGLLKPGGRLVAIMGEGAFFRQDKKATAFRDWLESVGGTDEKLAEGTFLDPSLPVNTGVAARMVVIEKEAGSAEQPAAAFSKPDSETGESLDYDTARRLKADLTKNWGDNAPVVILVEDSKGFPAAARQDPDSRRAEGVWMGKATVWINVGNIRGGTHNGNPFTAEQRFAQVLAHEAMGHFGVESVVGKKDWAPIVETLDRHRREGTATPKIQAILKEVARRYPDADKVTFAKEAIAVMAERGVKSNILNRVVAAIRKFLRKIMPSLEWSQSEVIDLLRQSESFLHVGTPQHVRQAQVRASMFSKAPAVGSPVLSEAKFYDRYHRHIDVRSRGDQETAAKIRDAVMRDGWKPGIGFNTLPSRPPQSDDNSWTAKRWRQYAPAAGDTVYLVPPAGRARDNPKIKAGWKPEPWEVVTLREGESLYDAYVRTKTEVDGQSQAEATEAQQPLFSRTSASLDRIESALKAPDAGTWEQAKAWMSGKWADLKPTTLKALQLRHVLELAQPLLPRMKGYADLVTEMGADRQALMIEVSNLTDVWRDWAKEKGPAGWFGKYNQRAIDTHRIMHDSTQLGVDPSREYQPLLIRFDSGQELPATKANAKLRFAEIRAKPKRSKEDRSAQALELKELIRLLALEKRRAAQYPALVARYAALADKQPNRWMLIGDNGLIQSVHDTDAKAKTALEDWKGKARIESAPAPHAIYRGVRDAYAQHRNRTELALVERIHDLNVPATQKTALADKIRAQFEEARVRGVYFPLQREGDYWISATKGKGDKEEQVFSMFESEADRKKTEKKLIQDGWTIDGTGRKDTGSKAKDAPSGTFVAEIISMLQQSGADEQVQDDIYQLYLRALPEMSMRKHSIHRKNIAGFSEDAVRAFAKNGFHGSHQLARLRYAHQLADTLDRQKKEVDRRRKGPEGPLKQFTTDEAIAADALLNELRERHEWIMSPKDSAVANTLTSFGFFYFLGLTPAAAMVNLTQGAQVTAPTLGARYGMTRAMRVLGKSTLDSMRTWGNIKKTLSPEERQAYEILEKQGIIERTQAMALAAISEGDHLQASPGWVKTMGVIGYLFQRMEIVNREGAAIAAFRLARSGAEGVPKLEFNAAVQYAADIVNGTHFDYGASNRAPWMQGTLLKPLTLFKSYSVGMTWLLGRGLYQAMKGESPQVRREARRQLTGMLGATFMLAGVTGLPLMWVPQMVMGALQAAFGDDEEPWDFWTEFHSWLNETVGEEAATFIAKGPVSALSGADVASRVGLGGLFFRESSYDLEGRDLYYHFLEQIAGPLGGIGKNVIMGQQKIRDGEVWRGVEGMLPKFVRDSMKAMRYEAEGVNNMRGDPILEDITPQENFLQAIGFNPTRVSEQYRVNAQMKNYEQWILDRRSSIMNAFALSIRMDDAEMKQATIERIQKFNQAWPEIPITTQGLRTSLRNRARYSAQADGGVVLNRRVAERIRSVAGE